MFFQFASLLTTGAVLELAGDDSHIEMDGSKLMVSCAKSSVPSFSIEAGVDFVPNSNDKLLVELKGVATSCAGVPINEPCVELSTIAPRPPMFECAVAVGEEVIALGGGKVHAKLAETRTSMGELLEVQPVLECPVGELTEEALAHATPGTPSISLRLSVYSGTESIVMAMPGVAPKLTHQLLPPSPPMAPPSPFPPEVPFDWECPGVTDKEPGNTKIQESSASDVDLVVPEGHFGSTDQTTTGCKCCFQCETKATNFCDSYTTVTLPKSLRYLAAYTFFRATQLKTVKFHPDTKLDADGLNGQFTFRESPKITELVVPTGPTTIGDGLLAGSNMRVEKLVFPATVLQFEGTSSCGDCKFLKELVLPPALTKVTNRNWFEKTALKYVVIPQVIGNGGNSWKMHNEAFRQAGCVNGNSCSGPDLVTVPKPVGWPEARVTWENSNRRATTFGNNKATLCRACDYVNCIAAVSCADEGCEVLHPGNEQCTYENCEAVACGDGYPIVPPDGFDGKLAEPYANRDTSGHDYYDAVWSA